MIEQAKETHLKLHNQLRERYVGREVTLSNCAYGKDRKGVIADLIFTYDVSFGVDVYRLDRKGMCGDRQWLNPRYVTIDNPGNPT